MSIFPTITLAAALWSQVANPLPFTPIRPVLIAGPSLLQGAQLCEAENPGESRKLQWKEQWLINTSDSQSHVIVCPVLKNLSDPTVSIALHFANTSGAVATMECQFHEYLGDGTPLRSVGRAVALGSGEAGALALTNFVYESLTTQLSVQCVLPPRTALVAMRLHTAEP